MRGYAKDRARERIADLAGQGLDLVTFWRAAADALAPAVPFDQAPCFYTLDPASLLVTSHYHPGIPAIPHEWLALEYYADDFNLSSEVARSARGIATLHEATGGEVGRSARYRETMRPLGVEQEVRVALRARPGEAWGFLALYRTPGQPRFDADELALLRDLAAPLAEGARRALLLGEAADPERPDAPGLVVLRDNWGVESLTPGVEAWLEALPGGDWGARGQLPPAVLAVARRALRAAEGADAPGEIAVARVLARDGRWVVLHGAALVATGTRRVAVIVEPAHPARIAPLLMAAYGLTEREQEVTRLVLQGEATAAIAARLAVKAQTVQQHLQNVFEKAGVRSRRELVGKVFFAHYEPRVRDNEGRARASKPLRGGPLG